MIANKLLLLDSVRTINGDSFARMQQGAHEAATSPTNNRRFTEAMGRAGNYKRGSVDLPHGLACKVDNPFGTFREGTSPDGTRWSNRMAADYGDIVGTKGADGDPVDVFIGPFPESPHVWVINQRRTWGDGGFDEHKVMAGFWTEAQARSAYLGSYDRGWSGLESIHLTTYPQLRQWLRSGDLNAKFSPEALAAEQGTPVMDQVRWNDAAEPVGLGFHQLMYGLRREDAGSDLLVDAATMQDLMGDPDIESIVQLDALVIEAMRMQQKMDLLKTVMGMAAGQVTPTEVTISDPVRARGVLQVMVLFQMSDGQTVSIWFHNPDTTPSKLTPLDELISWKWMLNKKDVTIVVAPERGTELSIREVARRIMRLVERNSAAFTRANEKAAERAAATETVKSEILTLEVELSDLTRKIDVARMERDEAPTPKQKWDSARGYAKNLARELREEVAKVALNRAAAATDAYGNATEVLELVRKLADAEVTTQTPDGLRSTVDGHAVEIRTLLTEAAKAAAPVVKPEPVAAPAEESGSTDSVLSHLGVPADDVAAMQADGGYDAIVESEALSLKWQDVLDSAMQQRLVDVRNALRKIGWAGTDDLAKDGLTLKPVFRYVGAGKNVVNIAYEIAGVTGFFMSDRLTLSAAELAARINMGLPAAAATHPAPPQAVPVSLAGDELGAFADGADGLRALRDAAGAKFEEMRGKSYPCPALSAEVEVRRQGARKVLHSSADRRKLYAVAALPALIGAATLLGKRPNYDKNSQNIVAYYTLRSAMSLAGEPLAVRFVVGQDDKGHYHYDHTVHAAEAVLDGVKDVGPAEASPTDLKGGTLGCTSGRRAEPEPSSHLPGEPSPGQQDAAIFDDAGPEVNTGGEVLNLFIEGEPPVPVQDEPQPLVVVSAEGRYRVAHSANDNPISPSYPTQEEAEAAAAAALATASLEFPEPSDGGRPAGPSNEDIAAAAVAGAEVRKVHRNLADPSLKGQLPLAHLATDDGKYSVALWSEEDVARAVHAVEEAERQMQFTPFDLSKLRMPTAIQLGLSASGRAVLVVKDEAAASGTPTPEQVLDGWSNGHLIDLTRRPAFVQKAIDKNRARRLVTETVVGKLVQQAKGRSTKVEPLANYDSVRTVVDNSKAAKGKSTIERVPQNGVVLEGGDVWTVVDQKYLAYFVKSYKGCEFFTDDSSSSVAVRQHGKLVGIIMPMNFQGDTAILARARRAAGAVGHTAQVPPADAATEIDPIAVVDAAYRFADATDEFKRAVAETVEVDSYSEFLSAKRIDERAHALGLSVSWAVEAAVLDSVGDSFRPGAAVDLFDENAGVDLLLDDATGVYLGQPKEAITATRKLVQYFRDFIRSDKELAVDPTGGWARGTMTKQDAQRILSELIDIAVNRKGGTALTAAQEDAYADFLHDARVINDYLHKRIRRTGSRNLLRHPKMKALYPEIDNQPRILDAVAAAAKEVLQRGAVLDDIPAPANASWPSSWIGFKVVDQAYVDQQSATILPSAQQIAGTVYLALETDDGAKLLVCGRVVGVSFSFGKVRYSVAVPIAPQQQVDVTLYAVIHDVDSVYMRAIEQPAPPVVLDAISDEHGGALSAIGKPDPVHVLFDFAGDVGAAITQLEIALDVVTTNEPINRERGDIEQADLERANAAQFRRAIALLQAPALLDDASGWESSEADYIVGYVKKGAEVLGRAYIAGDGKAMMFVGASGTERVTYVSPIDGQRRTPMWSDDDAGELVEWLVENTNPKAEEVPAGGGEPPQTPPATVPPVDDEPERPKTTEALGRAALRELAEAGFIGRSQRRAVESGMAGEEKQWFFDKMDELRTLINRMPKTYEADGQGGKATVHLHYFKGGGDWYITEKDMDTEQIQAFGLADLGHGGELGYISIMELTGNGVELDFHWQPKTLDEVRGTASEDEASEEEDDNIGRTWRSPSGAMEVVGYDESSRRYKTVIDDERPGLMIDPDDLEQQIRDDERAVRATEAEGMQRAAIIQALVQKHGWVSEGSGMASRVIGGGVTGGMVNKEGDRRVIASIANQMVRVTWGDKTLVSRLVGIGEDGAVIAADVNAQVDTLDPRVKPADNAPVKTSGIRPLQPQAPDRIEWEEGVVAALSEQGELDTGDAQGLMEAAPDRVDSLFARNVGPAEAARLLLGGDAAVEVVATEVQPQVALPSSDLAADRVYLQSLIDGTADMMDPTVADKLEPLVAKYDGDAEMTELINRAATAYSDAAVAAAKAALGT